METNGQILTASSLYAKSQGTKNTGQHECHWCGSAANSLFTHDDIMSREIGIPFSRNGAKKPGNPYTCTGCWLWQKQRITVHYYHPEPITSGLPLGLGATITLKDGQSPRKHSWWITDQGAWGITPNNGPALLKTLLKPPLRFVLMFLDGLGVNNHLHLAELNNLSEIAKDTPLKLTVNNIPHTYSVYELEQALKTGPDGKGAGVRFLFKLLKLQAEITETDDILDPLPPEPEKPNLGGRPILQKIADYRKTIRQV